MNEAQFLVKSIAKGMTGGEFLDIINGGDVEHQPETVQNDISMLIWCSTVKVIMEFIEYVLTMKSELSISIR